MPPIPWNLDPGWIGGTPASQSLARDLSLSAEYELLQMFAPRPPAPNGTIKRCSTLFCLGARPRSLARLPAISFWQALTTGLGAPHHGCLVS